VHLVGFIIQIYHDARSHECHFKKMHTVPHFKKYQFTLNILFMLFVLLSEQNALIYAKNTQRVICITETNSVLYDVGNEFSCAV
jgi:hypothetical protein